MIVTYKKIFVIIFTFTTIIKASTGYGISPVGTLTSLKSVEILPQLLLSNGVLDLGQSLTISGSDFTINENVNINIFGNSIENETINISANSTGKWQTIYSPSVSGAYYISATDLTNSKTTPTKTLIVNEVNKPLELELVSPLTEDYLDNHLTAGNTLALTWKDIANRGNKYPVSGTRREYKYLLEVSYDGGINWQEITLAGNWTDIGKQILEYRTFELTQESQNLYVRVIDYFDNTRVVESGPFKIGPKLNSDIKCGLVWDYSYPDRNGNPIGVAADGVARIYIKVFKVDPNTSADIRNVSITLSDGKNNFTDLLGKVMPASVTDEYSEEANNADQVEAVIEGNKNEYWFWYVAPDDFANEVNLLFNRTVYVEYKATYSSGTQVLDKTEIKIIRPPLALAHGLGGNSSDTWKHFRLIDNIYLFNDNRYLLRSLNLSPNSSFEINADKLLPTLNKIGLIPKMISEFRKKGFAINQVDYIGHSMGGNVLRYAIQEFSDRNKIDNNSLIKTKNYNQGFFHKVITLNTPHTGSFWADLSVDLGEIINSDEISRLGLSKFYAKTPNNMLSDFLTFDHNINKFQSTSAVDDLRINDGVRFTESEVKGHYIGSDFFHGSNNVWLLGRDFVAILSYMVDAVLNSKNKKLITIVAESLGDDGHSNDVSYLINKILNFSYSEDLYNSDIIVSEYSQFGGNSSIPVNASKFLEVSHSDFARNPVTTSLEVGKRVDELLSTSIKSDLFGNFHSGGLSKNGKLSKNNFLNNISITDTSSIQITQPAANTDYYVDSLLIVQIHIADTTNLVFVKLYFQNQVLLSTEKTNYYEFKTLVNGDLLDLQTIQVRAFYNYSDSTKFAIDECNINILPNSEPTNLSVSPIFTELEIDQFLYPEYNVEFENMVSRLGNNNEHIQASIENPNTVEFNPVNGSFKGINEGETSVFISYKGVSDTIYIAVRESSGITGFDEEYINNENTMPVEFKIHQNYPNPFNPTTTIEYSIPQAGNVVIKIYDLLGREIKILVNEFKQSGNYKVIFDGRNLSSGVYFYMLDVGKITMIRKMLLIK